MTAPHATIPSGRCQSCGHFAPVGEIRACTFCGDACPRHTAEPFGPYDPQTPAGAENALQALIEMLETARISLAEASDAEVEAELERDAARRQWVLSEQCPKAGTVAGVRTLAAEVTAWVEDRIVAEERVYRIAKARREAAEKYLSVVGKQLSAQQSINRSVGQAYESARGFGR